MAFSLIQLCKKLVPTAAKDYLKGWISPSLGMSFSQCGEDMVLHFLFQDTGIGDRISYLDLGANAPKDLNNTYFFYCHGGRGVCVEANPALIPALSAARPGDVIVNAAVTAGQEREMDLFLYDGLDGISTCSKDESTKRAATQKDRERRVVVKAMHIMELLQQHCPPTLDLLSIDIEGMDLPVLQAIDFKRFPIKAIVCETCAYSENHIRPKEHDVADFLCRNGYEVYADTYVNTIFVNRDWFYRT